MNSLCHYLVKSVCHCFILLLIGCSSVEPYKNPKLPIDKRVDDLISRMTIDEKISQLIDQAVAIPRLEIPEYNWWNEGLHGVARAGIATVFPQSIGLAATFDDSLIYEVATVISDEYRAKYNDFIKKGERDRYKGLTIWSPNINIFRDPRWGRGQETYGEDPFLTSRMGVAFVKGLQGNYPVYLKTIATPKHYVVHSGPEPLRHIFNAEISQRDFLDTYLAAFEACVVEGGAQSVMGAYNSVRGEACTGSPYLLTRILREEWGFDGYVVSDCGAIYDIYANHNLAASEAEAAAIALKAGCDLDCGREYLQLKEALEKGFCTEADIDRALKRLFRARMRLGMFDPSEMVPFNAIAYEVNNCPEHRQLSIVAAQKSIVLLKNADHILPLSPDTKTIAVIGPNANRPSVMYGNYNGLPSKSVTPLEGIRNKVSPQTRVLYAQGCSYHVDYIEKETIPAKYLSSGGKQGLTGEYFNNRNLEGDPFIVRRDSVIDFFWFNETPLHGMVHENYSMRWHGSLQVPKTGKYNLYITGDDGFRFFLDNKLLVDAWDKEGWKTEIVSVDFEAGSQHSIEIDYYQHNWLARIAIEWGLPFDNMEKQALDIAKQSDVILFFGGLSPQLEGEEMKVDLSGFRGGDRVSIDLPEVQLEMLKKLHALGKPVILILMSGSALAVNWADENLPAILEAWYPGQEGGTAIADVLFGDCNPAGRLPITFYKSVDQLPPFEDYSMKGRTYRFFDGDPLYEFGYGLSFTAFEYSNLKIPESISTKETMTIAVDIENTGDYSGDEVVQLYLKHVDTTFPVPIHALQAFKRIHLDQGEKKTVTFTLTPKHLSVIDDKNERVVLPGIVQVFIGGQQPDEKLIRKGKVLTANVQLTGKNNVIEKLDQ
jgi:beta-glucosidase